LTANYKLTDIKNGHQFGMPLKDFIEETWEKFNRGMPNDEYPIQMSENWYASIEPARRKGMEHLPLNAAGV
jgi:hypothetical protein